MLDRNNQSPAYMTGRFIAIIERYAGKKFGPGSLPTLFESPRGAINVWIKYVNQNDEYLADFCDFTIPLHLIPIAKSEAWSGYYHQKSAYDKQAAGGYRPNSGRPTTERKITLSVRISPEAHALLAGVKNKSQYIDNLIKNDNK